MIRKPLFCFILFLVCNAHRVVAADIVPVLLRVPKTDQPDTLGCNFNEQVTALVYDEIINGRVKLWDAPAKEIQITGSTLQELERASNTKFIDQDAFYIYENWAKMKSGINTSTIGFTFLNKNTRGEDVSYGYVDYNDLKDAFVKNKINTNANGILTINFATYLVKKMFNYNIVQFAGKAITTGGESQSIKADFIAGLEFNPSVQLPVVPDKSVTYIIDDVKNAEDQKGKNSHEIIKQIEIYLIFNEEVFFNIGGERLSNYITKNKIKVSKVECHEIWKKSEDGIYYLPKTITIFVNDTALNTIPFSEFLDFGFEVGSKSILQAFSEKDFSFIITNINNQKIARKDSYLYYKALMTYDWKKLSEFVKYY